MYCRLHTTDDIDRLLRHCESIEPDPLVVAATGEMLRWYARPKHATSLASFSRLLKVDGIEGFVSANLIPAEAGDVLESRRDKLFTYDLAALRPMTEVEMRDANRRGGATLFFTNLFWSPQGPESDILFCAVAVDRVVRWFEGNKIQSIMFTVEDGFLHLIQPLVAAVEGMVRRDKIGDTTTLFRISGPWRPSGLSADWARRLFQDYPVPKYALSDALKPKGRIFYEFHFDIQSAMKGCLPGWGTAENFSSWRKEASADLRINPTGNRRLDVTRKIKTELENNPRILTLY